MSGAALPFRVLVITDEDACMRAARGVVETVTRALVGHVAAPHVALLVRAHLRPIDDVRALCTALLPIARGAGALLLVHTHVELVSELGLAGAHVSAHADVHAARALLPPGALLGASRHDGDPLDARALSSVDYVTMSPVFAPVSKRSTRAPLGIDGLARACASSSKPVVALGGIDDRRAPACFRAGAPAVAAIGAVMSAHDPARVLRLMRGDA